MISILEMIYFVPWEGVDLGIKARVPPRYPTYLFDNETYLHRVSQSSFSNFRKASFGAIVERLGCSTIRNLRSNVVYLVEPIYHGMG